MIGLLFFFLGVLTALAALLGKLGLTPDPPTMMLVLFFYGLGALFGGVPIPWPRRGSPA